MNPKISVIIPTMQRQDLLRECLDSLRRQTFSDFDTILISDGGGDWVAQIAREYGCQSIALPSRRGFAAAINAGVFATRSEYVLLLNDDVRLDAEWLRLASALLDERPDAAFCCGKIYRASAGADAAMLDNAGDAVSLAGSAWRLGHGRPDSPEFDLPRTVLGCPGTASLVRRKLFAELGGLDEDFFAYLEDVDFSLRLARLGWRGLYLPQAKSLHWEGATSGGPESPFVFRRLTQNQLLILAKNYPWRLWPRITWAQLLWLGMAIRKRRLGAYLAGIAGFLRLLPAALRKRRPFARDEVAAFLARVRESEKEIYADVTSPDRAGSDRARPDRARQDTFWRCYFFLFPPQGGREARAKPGLGRLPIP